MVPWRGWCRCQSHRCGTFVVFASAPDPYSVQVPEKRYSLVFAREAYASLVCANLDGPSIVVTSRVELAPALAKRRPVVAFIDVDLLPQIDVTVSHVTTIVGIVDGSLDQMAGALARFPWVSHVVSVAMLAAPHARDHLTVLRERFQRGPEQHVLGEAGVGRVALLTSSNRREARFERLREFFAAHGLSERGIATIVDVAEELVTNALYDAPVEAGYFTTPIPRTEDIELPPEHACEISYGCEEGCGFVRIRDPFGALTRSRLSGVLNRCNSTGVELDESRGGAGLGLWRVFSSASTITITVIPGRLTDVLVWIAPTKGRATGKQLTAVHLFFPEEHALDGARSRFAADHDYDLIDESFTAMV